MGKQYKKFSLKFRTEEGISTYLKRTARTMNEALEIARKIAERENWRVVSVREFSEEKTEEIRELKWCLQSLCDAKKVGYTEVDFVKEARQISKEEVALYTQKSLAWSKYKRLCEQFYSEGWTEQLEKAIQDARRQFELARKNSLAFIHKAYDEKIDVLI